MAQNFDIAVIGGGASGLAAAITASRRGFRVILLEKADRVGKKLLATGNGRCNLTHLALRREDYHGGDNAFQEAANEIFDPENNRSFFRSLGVMTVAEANGKVFPLSYQAGAVVDMLRAEAAHRGVCTKTKAVVQAIKKDKNGFALNTAEEIIRCSKVIVACGGMAAPELGGSMLGYELLVSLGHERTELSPALVKIKTDNHLTNALKGIKVEADLRLKCRGKTVAEESGEVLFADYGISGPPVLQLSRCLCFAKTEAYCMEIDFLPGFSLSELTELLQERKELLAHLTLESYLTGLVQKKLGQLLLKDVLETKLSRNNGTLSVGEIKSIAEALKGFSLRIEGTLGWKQAQVTAGGIKTSDFEKTTMESRLIPGLYACGEILDIDGACGGYNLQWAWASGRLAGESAAAALNRE